MVGRLEKVKGIESPSCKEKWSGESSQISWASAWFVTLKPSNVQNILQTTRSKKKKGWKGSAM